MLKQGKSGLAGVSAAVVMSVTLCFVSGCSRDPNVRKQKYLESGKKYEDAGKYKEASIQFTNALKVDKNYGDAHYELAKTYMKMGSGLPAYGELLKTKEVSPNNLPARIDLGNLLIAGRQVDRAETEAKEVLSLNPDYADGYALLAEVEQRRSNIPGAIADMQRALQLDPKKANYHTGMALLQAAGSANLPLAEQELRTASSLDPKVAAPHLVLASLLEHKGDLQGAEQQYEAAIAGSPKDLQPRASLAGLYFRTGDKNKSEETLHKALEEFPDSEPACGMLRGFYVQTQQIDRAESVFAALTAEHPKSFPIKLAYAQLLADKKDFAKASAVAKDLTKTDGGNAQVQTLNALLLMNTGKMNEASDLLKKATKDNPNNLQTQLMLARVSSIRGDTAQADLSYTAAAKLSPGNLEAENGLAEVAVKLNDPNRLREVADRTIQLHPDFAQAYLWRGLAEANGREFDKADADYQAAQKRAPDNGAVYLALAELRIGQGKAADAKAMLEKALEKDPNSVQALNLLIGFDLQAKQPAKAMARVQAQLAKSPNNADFYNDLAVLQLKFNDLKGGLESAKKAIQLAPGNFGITVTYTRAEVAMGDLGAAISTWEMWLRTHPGDSGALASLGALEEGRGDPVKAEDYYKKALQADPNNATAANNLAYLMVENNENTDVALSLAQTARRIMPDSAETADTLAWTYYYKGNYSEAKDLLEGSLKTYPDNASIHLHLGLTYSKMNDKPDAQVHLKRAIAATGSGSKIAKMAQDELSRLGT